MLKTATFKYKDGHEEQREVEDPGDCFGINLRYYNDDYTEMTWHRFDRTNDDLFVERQGWPKTLKRRKPECV